MKNNGSVKRLEILLVVCLGIELEDLDDQLWHVLNAYVKRHSFINFECLLIGSFESDQDFILDSLELKWVEVVIEINQTFG